MVMYYNITYQPLPIVGCTKLHNVSVARLSKLHLAGVLHPSIALVADEALPADARVMSNGHRGT